MALEGEIFVKIDISPLGVETTHVYWNIQGFFSRSSTFDLLRMFSISRQYFD